MADIVDKADNAGDNSDNIPEPDGIESDGIEAERIRRMTKLNGLRERGIDPYPVRFDRDHTCIELRNAFGHLEPGVETDTVATIAGRLMLIRRQGKLIFATLQDGSGRLQLLVSKTELGDETFDDFERFDLGDWVGVVGSVMTTRRGELSLKVRTVILLTKALRPLPDKWHGLTDVDTRFRQREVDLIVNEEARRVFDARFTAIATMRRFLGERGFVEVETPVLHPIAGGAAARPFVTHHHALEMDLNLRIAPELYLKRLIVGGFEKVYELGRVFRNEGLSTRHNPEFTMLELYQAFVDYTEMMTLTQDLLTEVARVVLGTTTVSVDSHDGVSHEVDLSVPFRRVSMLELIKERADVAVHPSMAGDDLRKICGDLDVPFHSSWGPGKLVQELFEKTTEQTIVEPTFVLDHPREVSPLARTHRDDPDLVERFELIVGGRELANAFSELNDPVDQRERFEAQAALHRTGDLEAQGTIDQDYLRALEHGLPPCGGLGIGVDRLTMLLTGAPSIREVLLFPHLRPEAG